MTEKKTMQKVTMASGAENEIYKQIVDLYRRCPIPDTEVLKELAIYLNRPSLAHILFMDSLYQQIVNVHGSIIEFGVKWGKSLSLFNTLRHLYEPYNLSRRVIGFDTFEGFPSVSKEDGTHAAIKKGAVSVTEGYEEYLDTLLGLQEQLAPRAHVKKCELVKGDATKTFPKYLDEHPEMICALAYFDFDLYEPTKVCLELLRSRLTRGSIVVFDQLTWDTFPGETRAFQEILGSSNVKLRRDPRMLYCSYYVVE